MLIDAHVHLSLNGIDFQAARRQHAAKPDRSIIRNVLQNYKQMGITALRDGGDNLNVSLTARDLAIEEQMIVRTPVYALYKEGAYGNFLGRPVVGIKEFKQEFSKLIAQRPDHLKIIFTGLLNFDEYGIIDGVNFTAEELYYMIQSAKDKNLPAMVHVSSAEAIRMAILAGADTIEHGFYVTEEELAMMREQGTIWLPTLAPLGNLVASRDNRYADREGIIKKIFNNQQKMVLKAHEMGVKIAVGSDAGAYKVTHVQGYFDEVSYLLEAGLSREEIEKTVFPNGIETLRLTNKELELIKFQND